MGAFTDRFKKLFNPKAKTKEQTTRPAGKSKMLAVYFVRSMADKNLFIHPDGSDLFQPVYALKESTIGAAVFTNEMAELLMINWLAEYGVMLEKINFTDLQKEGGI